MRTSSQRRTTPTSIALDELALMAARLSGQIHDEHRPDLRFDFLWRRALATARLAEPLPPDLGGSIESLGDLALIAWLETDPQAGTFLGWELRRYTPARRMAIFRLLRGAMRERELAITSQLRLHRKRR